MIRKPAQAERSSPLRRGVEVAIDAGHAVQHTGRVAGKGCQVMMLGWLTFAMSIGALTAGSFGGMFIGLMVTGVMAYFLRRTWKRPIA